MDGQCAGFRFRGRCRGTVDNPWPETPAREFESRRQADRPGADDMDGVSVMAGDYRVFRRP